MQHAIDTRLTAIFRDLFDDDTLILNPETTAEDIEGWDSLGNITLMLTVAKEFAIKLNAAEIGDIRTVGDLSALIGRKISA